MKRPDLIAFLAIPGASAAAAMIAPALGAGMGGFALGGAVAGTALCATLLHRRVENDLRLLRQQGEETRRQAAALARVTRELSNRVSALDGAVSEGSQSQAPNGDIAMLGSLLRDLAQAVADIETKLENGEDILEPVRHAGGAGRPDRRDEIPFQAGATIDRLRPAHEKASVPAPEMRPAVRQTPAFAVVEPRPAPVPPEPLADRESRRLVAAAIAADRFELHLQPILGLPQRRHKAYEIMLRPEGAASSLPYKVIREAVTAVGHQPAFDRQVVLQAVRVAQALDARGRTEAILTDIGPAFLFSSDDVDDVIGLIADERGIAQRLHFGISQPTFRTAGPVELDSMIKLVRAGCRLVLTEVEDLRVDPGMLAERGFRWVRIAADRLIEAVDREDLGMDVSPSDLAALFARRGLTILAEQVESEQAVAELLELHVQMAQGLIMSPPRPFKLESLDKAAAPLPEAEMRGEEIRRGLRQLARQASNP